DAPIVDVAAMLSRRDRAHPALDVGRYTCGSQMRPHGHADTRKRGLAIARLGIADAARRQVFHRVIVSENSFGLHAIEVDRINRDAFLLAELLVEITPVG